VKEGLEKRMKIFSNLGPGRFVGWFAHGGADLVRGQIEGCVDKSGGVGQRRGTRSLCIVSSGHDGYIPNSR
jgi:hypothetical protein